MQLREHVSWSSAMTPINVENKNIESKNVEVQ